MTIRPYLQVVRYFLDEVIWAQVGISVQQFCEVIWQFAASIVCKQVCKPQRYLYRGADHCCLYLPTKQETKQNGMLFCVGVQWIQWKITLPNFKMAASVMAWRSKQAATLVILLTLWCNTFYIVLSAYLYLATSINHDA